VYSAMGAAADLPWSADLLSLKDRGNGRGPGPATRDRGPVTGGPELDLHSVALDREAAAGTLSLPARPGPEARGRWALERYSAVGTATGSDVPTPAPSGRADK